MDPIVTMRRRLNKGPVLVIASGTFIASFSTSFWLPFVPLYMKQLGATSDANALTWIGVAFTAQGLGRLVTGPVWGILSDQFGRRLMFIRTLYFATATTAIAALATEPWHVAIAFAFQGVFSGVIPASVALTSVTAPESELSSSLSLVTGAQYLGNTLGPAVGAGLAILFDLRGAILIGALMPAIAAILITLAVPRDDVAKTIPYARSRRQRRCTRTNLSTDDLLPVSTRALSILLHVHDGANREACRAVGHRENLG
jgi:MFS family permease